MPDEAAMVEQLRAELAAARQREAALAAENIVIAAERAEALEQQAATAEVLEAIASALTDLERVLQTIVETATRLCAAQTSTLTQLRERDGRLVPRVHHGVERASAEREWGSVFGAFDELPGVPVTLRSVGGRAFLERRTVHVPDLMSAVEAEYPDGRESVARTGNRTMVCVPMLRHGEPIGVLHVHRLVVRPFSEKQIALLETFADQAVIAIENARLFGELADLNRTLEARVGEQVGELERVGRLRRYLAPQLADLIVSSGDESILESHRRQISVGFCDLRGFTAFAETAEPEEVMAVLDEYHAAMGEQIPRYEGTLDHFAGDGIMVFFNDPLPQHDHAERAVRMACAMRDRAAELARSWRRAGHGLDFGVGIAVGYATLGRIGFEGRYDYTAIGTVANLAARLCGEAAGGQILIPARLHGMVEGLIEVEPAGELALKGFHRPVPALNITRLRHGELADDGSE